VSIKEGKTQEGKTPIEEHHNTQKWTNTKKSLVSKSPWHVPSKEWIDVLKSNGG
jgi:hypothetical protein